jgi:hypothetical protein
VVQSVSIPQSGDFDPELSDEAIQLRQDASEGATHHP